MNFTFIAEAAFHTFTVTDLDINVEVNAGETSGSRLTYSRSRARTQLDMHTTPGAGDGRHDHGSVRSRFYLRTLMPGFAKSDQGF